MHLYPFRHRRSPLYPKGVRGDRLWRKGYVRRHRRRGELSFTEGDRITYGNFTPCTYPFRHRRSPRRGKGVQVHSLWKSKRSKERTPYPFLSFAILAFAYPEGVRRKAELRSPQRGKEDAPPNLFR